MIVPEPLRQAADVLVQRIRGEVAASGGFRVGQCALGVVEDLRRVAGGAVPGNRQPGPFGAVRFSDQPGEGQQVIGVGEGHRGRQAERGGQPGQRAKPPFQQVSSGRELPCQAGDLPGAQAAGIGAGRLQRGQGRALGRGQRAPLRYRRPWDSGRPGRLGFASGDRVERGGELGDRRLHDVECVHGEPFVWHALRPRLQMVQQLGEGGRVRRAGQPGGVGQYLVAPDHLGECFQG